MKKNNVLLLGLIASLLFSTPLMAQKKEAPVKESEAKKTMTWTSKSEEAKELAQKGAKYFMNVEFPQAYDAFTKALELDPDFTVALVFMSNMTTGETKKAFAQRAIKSAADKTEGEKLFASLADEKGTPETRRETWTRLKNMFPDGTMIGTFYVYTRATPEERLAAAQDFIKKFPDVASMHNTIAYYYLQDKKDNAMAKKHFEKYLELYPEGYNPYDSMGEFYMLTGDLENAEKYYAKALERYPFSNSSVTAMEKITVDKKLNAEKKKDLGTDKKAVKN